MMKWMFGSITALFCAMMLAILGLLIFGFEGIDFACKRTFLLDQWQMLVMGVAALAAVCLLIRRLGRQRGLQRAEKIARYAVWPMLFGMQIVLSYFSYFLTGWDAGMMLEYAHWIGVFGYTEVNNLYYSMHPNNVLITMVFAWIMRLFAWIVGGEPGLDRCAFVVIAVQCLINTASGALCQDIVRRMTRSSALGWAAALVYVVFVGLSPWSLIPYTDGMTLLIPVLILWVYLRMGEKGWPAWLAIGLLTGLGYLLKPQAVIVTIALVMVEAARLFAGNLLLLAKRMAALALSAILVIGPGFNAVVAASGFDIDPEKNIGALHFMMMGLNEQTNGGFYAEDENITMSVETRAQRKEILLDEIARRISSYGPSGMAEHLTKKMMTNYADGTFAWGIEGQFYNQMIADKDQLFSPMLKRIIYPNAEGKMTGFATFCQCIWLALLMGCVLHGALWRRLKEDKTQAGFIAVTMLSIIGLTAFELMFEARARYLYIYAPFYVMLGVTGIWHMLECLIAQKKK